MTRSLELLLLFVLAVLAGFIVGRALHDVVRFGLVPAWWLWCLKLCAWLVEQGWRRVALTFGRYSGLHRRMRYAAARDWPSVLGPEL